MHTVYSLALALGLTGLMKLYVWGQKRYFNGLKQPDDLQLRVTVVEPAPPSSISDEDLTRLIPVSLAKHG